MTKNMTKKVFPIIFIIFISYISTSCSDNASLLPLAADATVLAFGDSLTYGTGTSRDKAYPAILQSLIKRKVINAGIPGEVSEKGLARLPGLIAQYRPDLIIICHGGNDILRKLDLSKTSDNIQKMIDLARQNDSEVILVGVPEFGLFLNIVPLYPSLAEKNNTPIAKDILADILRKSTLKSDQIHPNAPGYQVLAEELDTLIRDAGALPGQ